MSEVEITKMSSKGQVVVPQDIREELGAKEGTVFAVFASADTIILKKVETPSKEELRKRLERITAWGETHAKKIGVGEQDVEALIHHRRGAKHA